MIEFLIADRRSGPGAETFRHPTRSSSLVLVVVDVIAVGVAMIAFDWTAQRAVPFLAVLFSTLLMRGHYRTRMARDGSEDAATLVASLAASGFIGLVLITVFNVVEPLISTVVMASAGLFVILLASRSIAFMILKKLRCRGHLRSRAIVVGTGHVAREIGIEFGHRADFGVDIAGFVSVVEPDLEVVLPGPIIGNISDLSELARLTNSDRVIVTHRGDDVDSVMNALRRIEPGTISVFVMPHLFELGFGSDTMTPDRARGYALVRLGRSVHPVLGFRFKRLFDLSMALIATIILSPVLILTALAVRLSSRGPIFFRQIRVGQGGVEFPLLKFRSMRENSDSDVAWTPENSDASMTRIGRLLRRSSLDELPQLLNIIMGDMSIVGPRPERPVFVEHFNQTVPGYEFRHRFPVGLTGLAQVRGLRGDTPVSERVKADNLYIDQWSFFGDLLIIAKTIMSIARQRSYAEAEISLNREIVDVLGRSQVVVDLVAEEARLANVELTEEVARRSA